MTLNVHPAGDGMWFWYGRLYREHHLIYAEMHLPLQPLFVLLTAWMQDLLGLGWLQSKVLALMQLGAYCYGLWLLAGRIPWKDWQRATLLAATYSLTLTSNYFRFDDYHITGYCLVVFSIFFLLRIGERTQVFAIGLTALLGAVSGLALSNRLNDGAALFVGVAFALWFATQRLRWAALVVFSSCAVVSFFCVILLTGDSIHDWFLYSIANAAAIKGGSHSVLLGPFKVLQAMATTVFTYRKTWACAIYAAFVISMVEFIRREHQRRPGVALYRMWQVWAVLASASFLVWQSLPGHSGDALTFSACGDGWTLGVDRRTVEFGGAGASSGSSRGQPRSSVA